MPRRPKKFALVERGAQLWTRHLEKDLGEVKEGGGGTFVARCFSGKYALVRQGAQSFRIVMHARSCTRPVGPHSANFILQEAQTFVQGGPGHYR
jgi:hypothetical protein